MNRDNISDRFKDAQANAAKYPKNLLRSGRPHEVRKIDDHYKRLREIESALFDAESPKIEIWETRRNNAFQHSEYTTVGELQKHLERGPKDPQIRHGFLKSDDSRSPLNCSPEIFKTLSTHQQIDSSFLEAVYAFGDQEDPKDLCLMNFSSGHTLTAPQDKLVAIPELDRSGREIRVSYLLRSVEKKKNKEWPWQIRQAAVYHSFDTESGKSFWFTIKGNSQLSSRIMQVSSADLDLPSSQPPRAREDPIPYFRASLATHLIYISWCDENWRNCINDLENGIRKLLDSARKAPIDDDLPSDNPSKLVTYPRSLRQSRSNTMQSRNNTGLSRPEAGIRKQSTWGILNGASLSLMGTNNALPNAANADLEMAAQQPPIGALQGIDLNNGSNEALIDKREVLNRFRFGDIQTLHTYGDRIQRSILTLKLNISVLRDLGSFYQNLFALDIATFRNIKDACKDDLADFLDEVKSITRSLETRQTQLECLATLLTEGITLYDGILQHRQLDIAQRFQETARESAEQMQIIANKTKLETASMHVITIVTLLFLPATFVAVYYLVTQTFFQSGVIQWSEAPEGMKETYKFSGDGLQLFGWVSVPAMVFALGVWLTVYWRMRRGLRRKIDNSALPK